MTSPPIAGEQAAGHKDGRLRKLGLTQAEDVDELKRKFKTNLLPSLIEAFKEVLDSCCYGKARKSVLGRSHF